MFIAKIKTATVVLFGVAALGLGTGGVIYQTRAGAADPQEKGQQLPQEKRRLQQFQQPNAKRPADPKKHLLDELYKLKVERDRLLGKQEQIQKEAEQTQKQLAELDQKMVKIKHEIDEIEIVQAALEQTNPRTDQKPASGDKFDQILERLERLEKRLDRLEGRKPDKPRMDKGGKP